MRVVFLTVAALVLFTTLAQAQFGSFDGSRTCVTKPDGRGGYITVCR